MKVAAKCRVNHARGFASERKDIIDHDFSEIEGTALEVLLLTAGMPPVETPLIDHIGL